MDLFAIPQGSWRNLLILSPNSVQRLKVFDRTDCKKLISEVVAENSIYLSLGCFSSIGERPLFLLFDFDDHSKLPFSDALCDEVLTFMESLERINLKMIVNFSGRGFQFLVDVDGFDIKEIEQLYQDQKPKNSVYFDSQGSGYNPAGVFRVPGSYNYQAKKFCFSVSKISPNDLTNRITIIKYKEKTKTAGYSVLPSYPCLEDLVRMRNPSHEIRWLYVLSKKLNGFSKSQTFALIKSFNWVDYSAKQTKKQLDFIFCSSYSISCKTIKRHGVCHLYPTCRFKKNGLSCLCRDE